jgi:hypothetical protein
MNSLKIKKELREKSKPMKKLRQLREKSKLKSKRNKD